MTISGRGPEMQLAHARLSYALIRSKRSTILKHATQPVFCLCCVGSTAVLAPCTRPSLLCSPPLLLRAFLPFWP